MLRLVMRGYGSSAPLISAATQSAISPAVCGSCAVWVYAMRIEQRERMMNVFDVVMQENTKGCEEKHSNTTAHHPVVKPPAAASTAV